MQKLEDKVKLNSRIEEVRRSELPERYTVKLLFKWDNEKFEDKYLKKLERNWQRWKSVSLEEKSYYLLNFLFFYFWLKTKVWYNVIYDEGMIFVTGLSYMSLSLLYNQVTQRRSWKVLEQMTSYHMATTY